jgi:hypothetical protein
VVESVSAVKPEYGDIVSVLRFVGILLCRCFDLLGIVLVGDQVCRFSTGNGRIRDLVMGWWW